MPRLVAAALGLICLGVTSPARGQSRMIPQVPVGSCGYADSLLGTDWERGSVTASRGPDGLTLMTSAVPGVIRTTIEMNVSLEYRDSVPPRDPYGTLKMTVFNDRGLAQALLRPDTTALVLVLDDTLSFSLGSPIESEVRGATRASHLPFTVNLPRNPFLALARAKKGRAEVAGRSYPIGRQLLRAMSRTYRAAICIDPDSLPK